MPPPTAKRAAGPRIFSLPLREALPTILLVALVAMSFSGWLATLAGWYVTEIGRQLGLVDDARWRRFEAKREAIEREQKRLQAAIVRPASVDEDTSRKLLGDVLRKETRALDLMARPEADYAKVTSLADVGVVADILDFIPELTEAIEESKS